MANLVYIALISVFTSACASSQKASDPDLIPIARLPDQLKECSGMIDLNNGLYLGHNDSGNPAELFLFRLDDDDEVKRIRVTGATNVDWEDVADDDDFVYISDTGNNSGTRKELTIYRANKTDILSGTQVVAEQIIFEYSDQKSVNPSNKHNFDCEALICVGDSLFVFTKNRGNGKTSVYGFPKSPGRYVAKNLGTFDAGGLVTGADFKESDNVGELVLIGYTFKNKGYHPFILKFPNVTIPRFFDSKHLRYSFTGKLQTETILIEETGSVLVSNEEEHGDIGYIYRVDLK